MIITQRKCHRLNRNLFFFLQANKNLYWSTHRNHAFNFILYLKPLLRFTMSVGSQNIVWHQEFSNALLPSILRSSFPGAPCPELRVNQWAFNMESLCRLGSIFRGSLLCFILMATSHNPRFIPWSLTYVFDLWRCETSRSWYVAVLGLTLMGICFILLKSRVSFIT